MSNSHIKSKVKVISKQVSIKWLMLIYFLSGACSLIDEVIWVRLLKLILGNTVYASSIVVSVFMGGLALGALIMSRYCDSIKNRLRLYALLEVCITITALLIPFMLRYVDRIYIWFYQSCSPSNSQLLLVQVIISALILIIPSMLMGSTLPLLGRFVTDLEKDTGYLIGRLYALNTLGAAMGCFIAGFILIRALGVMGTLYTAAGMNLLVAFGGWILSHTSKAKKDEVVLTNLATEEISPEKTAAGGRFYLLVIAFFMSGLISIGYELLWMRSIVHIVGGFTYVFSAVLTIYLLGNVIGAVIGSRLAKRLKVPAIGFSVTLLLLGLCGIFFLPVLILWVSKILPKAIIVFDTVYSAVPVSPYMLEPITHSIFLFLIPSIIMGIGFPIALQAWAFHMHMVGKSTGTAYGANTIGSVAGGIVTGFVLIPLLGLQISMTVLSLAGIWIACLIFLFFVKKQGLFLRLSLPIVAVAITVISTMIPSDMFNTVVKISPIIPDWELVDVKEGHTTTVSLHKETGGSLQLYSSGQSIAGDSYIERGDQKMLGHFGVILNKNAKRVLSVGFGSGETTACLARHKLDRVDCVEIAPEVVEVSLKYFRHINLGERLNEEVNMIYMDAKNYLHLTDNKYDVIINDSIHPRDFAENASLYSREYFESAKKRLNENGMILSWLPTYDMPESVFRSVIGTVMDVFPHVTLWCLTVRPAQLVLVAGSEKQQYYSIKYIEDSLLKEGVSKSLSEISIFNSRDILSCYVTDEKGLKKYISDYSVNSDYFPFIEFNTDKRSTPKNIFNKYVLNVRNASVYDHIDWSEIDEKTKKKWISQYRNDSQAYDYLLMSYGAENPFDEFVNITKGLSISPDNIALLEAKKTAEKSFLSVAVIMITSGDYKSAGSLASTMLQVNPKSTTAWMINSLALHAIGDLKNSLAAIQKAVELEPENPEARLQLGFIFFRNKQYEKSIAAYNESLNLKADQPAILERLAYIHIMDKCAKFYNPSKAVSFAEKACELTGYKNLQNLNTLSLCYNEMGRITEAIATMEIALNVALNDCQYEIAERLQDKLLYLKSLQSGK